MMNKEAKKNYVEEMKKNFTSNESVMIAQYQGLNVTELDELRKELREKGILFKITKNRITKIAIKETPVKDLEKYFTGPTAAAISSDPIATAKVEELIRELKQKYTIIIVTHNMQQASRISDYTAFFYMGDMIEYNKTDTIFRNPQYERTQNYITGRFG